jgi:hypothetical protein
MAISLLQELQSSVLPGPKIRAGGLPPTELFNRYVIVVVSELFRNRHADFQSVTQALAHDCSVNHSTAPRPQRCGFKFENNSRKWCDTFEKKTFWTLQMCVQVQTKGSMNHAERNAEPTWRTTFFGKSQTSVSNRCCRATECILLTLGPSFTWYWQCSGHSMCVLNKF